MRKESRSFSCKKSKTEKCAGIFLGSRTVSLSRSSGETLAVQRSKLSKKMREVKTALKSGSSPLALFSFPKLLTPLRFPHRLSLCLMLLITRAEKCAGIFLGSRTVSLSRSSGETLVVQRTKLSKKMREEQTALKSGSSPLALPSFPKLFDRLCDFRKDSTGITEEPARFFHSELRPD